MNKRKYICLFTIILLVLSACTTKSNEKNSPKKQDGTSAEIDTNKIKSKLMDEFDSINKFESLSDDEILIVGRKDNQQVIGDYNLKTSAFNKSSNPIQYSMNDDKIHIANGGFYITSIDKVRVYDSKFNLTKEIAIPNKGKIPLPQINPVCLSNDSEKLYYSKMNEDFTISLMEHNLKSNTDKVVFTYAQQGALSLLTDMEIVDNDTIAFIGQTPPSADKQSITSYGTIKISDGKLNNNLLAHIQLKYGRDIVTVTDEKDPTFISKPKNYIFLIKGNEFVKETVKGADDVQPCSEQTFITHETKLDDHNVYTSYNVSLYDAGKVVKTYDESGKYHYGDYMTDFYANKYGLYFQAIYTTEEKSFLNVYDIHDKRA